MTVSRIQAYIPNNIEWNMSVDFDIGQDLLFALGAADSWLYKIFLDSPELPPPYVLCTLAPQDDESAHEIVKIVSGDFSPFYEVERAQEGTVEQDWPTGSRASFRLTRDTMIRHRDMHKRLLLGPSGGLLTGIGGDILLSNETIHEPYPSL